MSVEGRFTAKIAAQDTKEGMNVTEVLRALDGIPGTATVSVDVSFRSRIKGLILEWGLEDGTAEVGEGQPDL